MSIAGAFLIAADQVLVPTNMALIVLGTTIGLVMGVIPGMGGTIALVLLIPLTYGMDPLIAFMFLTAALGGTNFGGSITAILINTPGMGPNAATLLDGFPMTRQGRAGEAIGASATASALGAIFGVFVLLVSIPVMLQLVLLFGPAEIFWLGVWGLTIISTVVRGSVTLGLLSAVMGFVLALHGQSASTGALRWTYDVSAFIPGIGLIPIIIGLFAIAEMIDLVSKGQSIAETGSTTITDQWSGVKAVFAHKSILLRSAVVGSVIGIIPGIGGTVANFVSYFHVVQTAGDAEGFGQGDVRGVIASEASNDAKDGGAFIPTIAFGIPGSASMAVLLSAFILHGITPGPTVIQDNLPIVAIIIISLLVSNVLTSVIGLFSAKRLVTVTEIDIHYIAPIVIVIGFLGSYAFSQNIVHTFVVLPFGILGFVMKQVEMSRIPLILAYVLTPVIETHFLRSLYISDFDPSIFFSSAISVILILLIIASLGLPYLRPLIRRAEVFRLDE